MDFTTIVNAHGANLVAGTPSDVNGTVIELDFATNIDFVQPRSKIVLNAQNRMNPTATVGYMLYQLHPPVNNVPHHLTNVEFQAIVPLLRMQIYRMEMLLLFQNSSIAGNVRYRATDTFAAGPYAALADIEDYNKFAAAFLNKYTTDKVFAANLVPNPMLGPVSLIACAAHRKATNGHSWLTAAPDEVGSVKRNCLDMAKQYRAEFAAMMTDVGHEIWHFLTDDSIRDMADALTGVTAVQISNNVTILGKAITANTTTIFQATKVLQTACDRWPTKNDGVALLFTGMDAIAWMVSDVMLKKGDVVNADVSAGITRIRNLISGKSIHRNHTIALRSAIEEAAAIAYGYVSSDIMNAQVLNKYKTLEATKQRRLAAYGKGKTLGDAMRSVVATPESLTALTTAIGAALEATVHQIEVYLAAHQNLSAPN